MKITKIENIYQLAFLPNFFPVNAYFVEEEESLTLIDAALPYSYKGILKAAEIIGKPIEHILLTHAHADHIGALEILRELLPDAKICISKRDNRLLMGDLSLDAGELNTPIKGGVPKDNKVKADVLLSDGDSIGSLLAISAPGHTPGLMVYMDTRNSALIVGDAFQARGGIAVAGHLKPLFPFPALATWNKQAAIDSAVRLVGYKPSLLACGHGAMIKNPSEKMMAAIKEAQRALNSSNERRSK